MKTYHHTQQARLILAIMTAMSVMFIVVGAMLFRPLLFSVPFMILGGWLFHSLTIEVADGELRWRFGSGFVRKRVPLREIASAQVVRTNFIEGWGIHHSRYGWLYNVSGYDAVAIALRDGKRFCLGTDEPEKLAEILRNEVR